MNEIVALFTTYVGLCLIICLFVAIVWFIVLLILRPLVMWYLKINTIIENQEVTNGYLADLVSQNENLLKELSKQKRDADRDNNSLKEHERYMPK